MKNGLEAPTGRGWIKILGIITFVGILIAVARIVLRVFNEKPADTDEIQGI